MTEEQGKDLLKRYENNQCTLQEKAMVESWYADLSSKTPDMPGDPDYALWQQQIKNELPAAHVPVPVKTKLWPGIAAAASVVLCLGAGLYFYNNFRHPEFGSAQQTNANIKPGRNKAYLTLGNGNRITLTDAANGTLAQQSGVSISKTADGQLVYSVSDVSSDRPAELNTIETPKGGQYQVKLPDGTVAWLNAASRLTYPASFAGRKNRTVEISGEAYFEVKKDRYHPFIVKSTGQEIQVLGTHFNISAYQDEPATKTTLLEGSVLVTANSNQITSEVAQPIDDGVERRNDIILKPGQQSALSGNQLKVQEVDIEDAVAWKNGKFIFAHETIQSIMRKIARWYDVEIAYQDIPRNNDFSGSMSRFENINQILRKIEMTNEVHFKIEGRRITILK